MTNPKMARRSNCPLSVCLEIFGDRWSLLIVRDLMFRDKHEFGDFLVARESIATNVLADRLRRMEAAGLIRKDPHPDDARKSVYSLSAKGFDLAPTLIEMSLWAQQHERTDKIPDEILRAYRTDRRKFVGDLKARSKRAAK